MIKPFSNQKAYTAFNLLLVSYALLMSGCAISPGLRTGELPQEGKITTQAGMLIEVKPLSVDVLDQQKNTKTISPSELEAISQLFNQPNTTYRLDSGDVLTISLWAYPEIAPPATITSGQSLGYTIDQEGLIDFPLIGSIKAKGKTIAQFSRDLRNQLTKYLKQPDAQVRILSYQSRKFFVGGQVKQSGEFIISDQPVSAYGAISKANGITEQGDIQKIRLTRHGINYNLNFLQLEQLDAKYSLHSLYMHQGDTLYVNSKENNKIYVLGEAGSNKPLTLREEGMSLADVIGESEGLNALSANPAKIYVVRTDNKDYLTHVYQLDLSQIANIGLAQKFSMQSNDVVYVDATGLTRWNRIISQIMPSATATTAFRSIANY